jgi:hypothetical protein
VCQPSNQAADLQVPRWGSTCVLCGKLAPRLTVPKRLAASRLISLEKKLFQGVRRGAEGVRKGTEGTDRPAAELDVVGSFAKGQRARLTLGDPLPEEHTILPSPEALAASIARCTVAAGREENNSKERGAVA